MEVGFRKDGAWVGEAGSMTNPVFYVPHARNEAFTGRETLIDELQEDVTSADLTKHVQALYGMGGVGKTQVAVEFAHRYADRFKIVWWLRAEGPASVWIDYAALARRLGLEFAEDAPLETVRHALRSYLSTRGDYLLIFDNADSAAAIRDFIPEPCRGAVLITSRSPSWGSVARSTAIHGLTRDEAVQFLRRRTGRMESDQSARKLAQALGDLPLALEQAGALIAHTRMAFGEYLRRFEAHWAELLQLKLPGGDYPDSVAMTWELSLRQIAEDNPTAIRLMNLLAFLSPDGIPRGLLARSLIHLPQDLSMTVADRMQMDRAIESLRSFSLIEVREEAEQPGSAGRPAEERQVFSLHRLVAALARDRLDEDERRRWAGVAARVAGSAFSFNSQDVGGWAAATAALPHALAAAHHAQSNGVPIELTCGLLDETGRYLNRFGQFDQAKGLLDQALALSRRAYGDESPKVSAIANNLGRVLARLGQRELARQHFEWAMAIDRNTYGDGDPHVATVMNNYAMVLHATGQLDSARQHFESALAIFEQSYGPEHPKVATLLNNLGYIHQAAGDDASAHDLFHRALTTAEATLVAPHPTVAAILHNLGKTMRKLGHPLIARDHLERALSINLAVYGENHPDVARDYSALAELLRAQGDAAGAEQYDAKAAAVRQAVAEAGPKEDSGVMASIES
jgi:tetratricopeptide (TPR) repeat protein